ncbi:MAG: TIGR01777 family oxidoreductase [Candidatus Methylomirabilota bacterium]
MAVSGSRGLVGSVLIPRLAAEGHEVIRLVRGASAGPTELGWSPHAGFAERCRAEGLDAVVHLAGENIASGRWTAARKAEIRQSRVEGTRRVAEGLAGLATPPRVLVCASAVGYYGDRGAEILTEQSPPGEGFLAEVCQAWEAAADPARQAGIRVVHLRFGAILTPAGGALARMLLPFRLGLGGPIGSGEQYLSWIGIDDAVGALLHALVAESLAGAVNAVAPTPLPNREFARLLGNALSRPAILPLPAFAVRLLLGEMADPLLLASSRVVPAQLLASGYRFRHPDLEGALRYLLAS